MINLRVIGARGWGWGQRSNCYHGNGEISRFIRMKNEICRSFVNNLDLIDLKSLFTCVSP